MSGVRVISERTLDNKTIKMTDTADAIEVGVSAEEGNAVSIKEDGLYVKQAPLAEILLTDLSGNPLGKLVEVDAEPEEIPVTGNDGNDGAVSP